VDVSQMVGIEVFGSTQINGIVRPCFLVIFWSSGVFASGRLTTSCTDVRRLHSNSWEFSG
jgi:demethoxyubiquinone hydroxylase (CLK1/Coq7/Cat5 family)